MNAHNVGAEGTSPQGIRHGGPVCTRRDRFLSRCHLAPVTDEGTGTQRLWTSRPKLVTP